MIKEQKLTYWVKIHLSGESSIIEQICRRYCMKGLCVTVKPERFIYRGGQEDGAVVELINYPRFPKKTEYIWTQALELAEELRTGAFQHSVLIMDPDNTLWITDQEIRENG